MIIHWIIGDIGVMDGTTGWNRHIPSDFEWGPSRRGCCSCSGRVVAAGVVRRVLVAFGVFADGVSHRSIRGDVSRDRLGQARVLGIGHVGVVGGWVGIGKCCSV